MSDELTWTSGNGNVTPISELNTNHLKNIVAKLDRDFENIKEAQGQGAIYASKSLRGEIAEHFLQQVGENHLFGEASESDVYGPVYDALVDELQSRQSESGSTEEDPYDGDPDFKVNL